MIDTTIYRRIYIDQQQASLNQTSNINNKKITNLIENAIRDLNEIMRSKVSALNGNCILGYNIEIFRLREEFNYSHSIFLGLSATGDAVKISATDNQYEGIGTIKKTETGGDIGGLNE